MPEKPLEERIKRAKRLGVPFAVKKDDLGSDPGQSRHAVKKSRGVVGLELPPDRRVGRKAAPGMGRNRIAAAAGSTPGRGNSNPGLEIQARHVAPVRGRKKPPSQMHIRRPGG